MMAGLLASCSPTPVGGTWLQQKKQCKRRHNMASIANLSTRAVTPCNILGSSSRARNWVKYM